MSKYLRALVATIALTACPANTPKSLGDPVTNVQARLTAFKSCEALREHVALAWTEQFVGWGYAWDVALEDGDDGGNPSDYSETNLQEEGVDEPDIVKTDGEYIYVLQPNGDLIVLDSWPAADTAEVGRLELEGWPHSMFLHGDRLVVFTHDAQYGWDRGRARTTLFDVSDPSSPSVVRTLEVDGWFIDARRIGDDIYTVTSHSTWAPTHVYEAVESLDLPDPDWNAADGGEAARAEARGQIYPTVKSLVDAMPMVELLPRAWDIAPDGTSDSDLLLQCSDVYRPDGLSVTNTVAVSHFSLEEGGEEATFSSTGAMADGWQVYASTDSLYLSQTSWWWWWGYGDDLTLQTHLHRFALDGEGTTYAASGAVDGWLLNRFSMSEYDGYLRIATTDNNWWGWGWGADADTTDSPTPANNVFVLQEHAGELNTVGTITGIAPNEQIQAARFIGERGFLVTFEQIDPLFTLDLSDPIDPVIVGELKLPGFSSYLHPLDDDYILAVGQAGTDEGQITGLQVTLFDVSDFAIPLVGSQLEFNDPGDWSSSAALWDPHAFTLHRDVLTIPLYWWDDGSNTSFSGMVSVEVDVDAGLGEIGRVDHADILKASECDSLYGWDEDEKGDDNGDTEPVPDVEDCADWLWYATMRRSVVIEDNLYTISDFGVRVTDLLDPSTEFASVVFYPTQ